MTNWRTTRVKPKLSDFSAIVLAFAGFLFLFTGYLAPVKPAAPVISSLILEQKNAPFLSGSGFAENAVYSSTTSGVRVKRFGSWLGSDVSTGKVQSSWFLPVPEFNILVAGYPSDHGCNLYIEVEREGGAIDRLPIAPRSNPKESWQNETISLANIQTITRFRLVAVDGSSAAGGWVGFSEPYEILGADTNQLSRQLFMAALTAAAALVAVFFPGLFWRWRSCAPGRSRLAFIWIPVPGFLGLALAGLLCWIAPPPLGVRHIAQWFLIPLLSYALYHLIRFPLSMFTTGLERRVLLAILVLTSLSVAKSLYSLGPEGELYAGQISRTLEVGDRSDSRVPYHLVQLVARSSRPYSRFATSLLSPFNFSHRGPLVGLAVSTIVLAAPVSVTAQMPPNQPWTVYDPEGFSAYRISMIVVACASLTAVFGLACFFLNQQWAFLAFLVVATTPFIIHETYFTWPKLEAVWFVLLSAYLILCRRYFMAGLLLGIGYLCHPLALLSIPALLGVAFLSNTLVAAQSSNLKKLFVWSIRAVCLFAGLSVFMLLWWVINRKHYSQDGFLHYVFMAGDQFSPYKSWLSHRWDSVCNTLVPLYLFLVNRSSLSVNSADGPSPPVVQFYFQYWNTLPFGVGITYFFFLSRFLFMGFIKARAWLLLVFVLPFAVFSVYWGAASTGLLREGLHAWGVGILIFSVVIWNKTCDRGLYSRACSVALLLRGIETLLMLVLPSILSQHKLIAAQFGPSDTLLLLTMTASAGWLYATTFQHAWSLSAPAERVWTDDRPVESDNIGWAF